MRGNSTVLCCTFSLAFIMSDSRLCIACTVKLQAMRRIGSMEDTGFWLSCVQCIPFAGGRGVEGEGRMSKDGGLRILGYVLTLRPDVPVRSYTIYLHIALFCGTLSSRAHVRRRSLSLYGSRFLLPIMLKTPQFTYTIPTNCSL